MRIAAFLAAFLASTPALAGPKFPIALWMPQPLAADVAGYPNQAAAMAAEHFNIVYGLQGKNGVGWWPEAFGADKGELALMKSLGLYVIAGYKVPYNDTTAANSVASVQALAAKAGAEDIVLGYAPSDEPSCLPDKGHPIPWSMIPTVAAWFHSQDPKRLFILNETAWMAFYPSIKPDCLAQATAAIQATDVASQDNFVLAHVVRSRYAQMSDFATVANDTLWMQDMNVQGLRRVARPGQPVWAYVEGGGDNLVSGTFNSFPAGVTNGSNVLVNAHFGQQTWNGSQLVMKFTPAWIGLTVSGAGIPPGTTIIAVRDENHAIMSAAANTGACTPAEIPLILTAGSKTVTLANHCADLTNTGYAYRPIVGNGIPPGTALFKGVDKSHSTMNHAATVTGRVMAISAAQTERVTISGGAKLWLSTETGDCIPRLNLCVVNGNAYRASPSEVNAEVWMSLIDGANGIEYFCGDQTTYMFCLGAGKDPAAQTAQANTAWINATVLHYADILNSPTLGQCSTETLADHTGKVTFAPSCSSGVLKVATSNAQVPALALVKALDGVTYLFAQSARRTAAGVRVGFTVAGMAGKAARVIYDSDSRYDPAQSTIGRSFPLGPGASFEDVFGANGDSYQVKIYAVR